MSFGVSLAVWGEYACFTRPEFKTERVSYDVITPSAARGLLEAVYWKPAIAWVVDRIRVLNPIRFDSVRRNEVGCKIPLGAVTAAMKDPERPLGILVEDERQQRATLLLRDVRYVIDAHFEARDEDGRNTAKHRDIFLRRAARGQCFHMPYLGCREFPASFQLMEGDPPHPHESLLEERDLGWMLHDLDYGPDGERQPRFFRACMQDGVIEVPPLRSPEVRA